MDSCYLPVRTQYNNKTGHHYVQAAQVALSKAGLPEVYVGNDIQLLLTDHGHLSVSNGYDLNICLTISNRDRHKMEKLLVLRDTTCL